MPTEHRLAAIMFTDIVGSTAVTARSEPAGLALRDRHRELVRGQVDRYHGRFIEAPGDECLATFESALDSVNCALAIQQELEDATDLKVRIGIHLGEIVFRGDEVFGDGVNIAARIIALAEPAEIYVSAEVADALRNQPNLELSSRGEHRLKNVGRPVGVFRVQGTPGAPRPAQRRSDTGDGKQIRSLAVLPLENLSADPEQEYFADGMTDALIGDLAKIASLRVISRISVMRFKGTERPLSEVAGELNVDAVVEGTVMRAEDRVRITAQLIDARIDSHLWAQSYERELRDVLALQGEIARAVAREVEAEVTPEEQSRLHAGAVDPAAHDAYLRGVRHASAFTPADARLAIEYYEKATALEPAFAPAYVGMAWSYHTLGFGLITERDPAAQSKASAAARQAVELAPDLGAAQTMLGLVRLYDWDWAGARDALGRAVQLSPSDPLALYSYGEFLAYLGEHPEALRYAKRAVDVAPLDPFFRTEYGSLLRNAGHYDRATAVLNEVIEMQPDYAQAWYQLAVVYALVGDHEQAYAAILSYSIHIGANWVEEALRRGYRGDGLGGAFREWRGAMIDRSSSGPVSGMAIASLAVFTGETDLAFTWLDRAVRDRDPMLRYLHVGAWFDPIRSDTRYRDILRRINYPGAD